MIKFILIYFLGVVISYFGFGYIAIKNQVEDFMVGVILLSMFFPIGWITYFILRMRDYYESNTNR